MRGTEHSDGLGMCLVWRGGESSPRLLQERRATSPGRKRACLPPSPHPPQGRAKSWYLKDGGHGFVQVIVVTWLLDKDVP